MNTTMIEHNTPTEKLSVITRKEFIAIWKKISNDQKIKPLLVERKLYDGTMYKEKVKGWIYPEHHILYNLIRNLPIDRGFQPNTDGYKIALSNLKDTRNFHYKKHLLLPFQEFLKEENILLLFQEIQKLL